TRHYKSNTLVSPVISYHPTSPISSFFESRATHSDLHSFPTRRSSDLRRFHHRPVDRGRRHGTDWAEGDQQRSDQRPEKRAHADGAGRHRQGSGGDPSGRHGTGATEQGHS